jgi:hypothetical protein
MMIIRWVLEEDDVLLEIDGTEISQARTAGTAPKQRHNVSSGC